MWLFYVPVGASQLTYINIAEVVNSHYITSELQSEVHENEVFECIKHGIILR